MHEKKKKPCSVKLKNFPTNLSLDGSLVLTQTDSGRLYTEVLNTVLYTVLRFHQSSPTTDVTMN